MNSKDILHLEERYLMDEPTLGALVDRVRDQISPDFYSHYTVSDLYLEAAPQSAAAPVDTLRLRGYGVPTRESSVYLERNMQWGGLSCRRRIAMTLAEAEGYLSGGPEGYALRAQDQLCEGAPAPKLFLAFERDSYAFPQSGLRLTLDSELRYRTEDLDLLSGDGGSRLLPEGYRLVCIKGIPAARLLQAIGAAGLQPVPFSKYGYALIAATLQERRGKR